MIYPRHHFWIEPNRFLAGQHPQPLAFLLPTQALRALLAEGFNTFIDLTQEDETSSYAEHVHPCDYHRFPIDNAFIPEAPVEMTDILDHIDTALTQGGKVYLHCWGGRGRTGIVAGCWLARHGHPGEAALQALQVRWATSQKGREKRISPETELQRRFILQWNA